MAKLRITFIYRPDNPYLCGLRSNNNYEKFYLKALKESEDVEIDYYGSNDELDCRFLGGYDVYLFFDAHEWGIPPKLKNVDSLKGLKVCSIGDAHGIFKHSEAYGCNKLELTKRFGIDYCFYQHAEPYFYRYWPKDIKYWWIPVGIDPVLYENVKPFKDRRSDKILLSGSIGSSCYPIRTKYRHHDLVHYHKPGSYKGRTFYKPGDYDKDKFKDLLENWKFSIASACSVVLKYFEIPAAGCLSLAYVDDDNGCSVIGFEDNETAVLINQQNALERMNEVIQTSDDPKWERIARKGRQFVFENYTHQKCVQFLLDKIKEVA